MDFFRGWHWGAWVLFVLLVLVIGTWLWRLGSALVFQRLLFAGFLSRRGWHGMVDTSGPRWPADEARRKRVRQAMVKGPKAVWEGFRSGKFKGGSTSPWHTDVEIAGSHRGRAFVATQRSRFARDAGAEGGSNRKTERSSWLEVQVDAAHGGPAPKLVGRWRFRGMTSSGSSLRVRLGARLRRGRLLAGLDYLNDVADQLRRP